MGGGTLIFPDLGKHCQHPGCNQLDFLPFECDGCQKVFCLEHRSYELHECPNDRKSRKVVVCDKCSASIETTGRDGEDKAALEKHERSNDCDPSKKKKPRCPVKRCKESLTFSNSATCKSCNIKVCLKHRFPADHVCEKLSSSTAVPAKGASNNSKFLAALAARSGKECAKNGRGSVSPPSTPHSVKAC
uniref:SAP6 n=1 Tax=Tamarix hispida TaxID=189793 RepID=A0A8F8T0M9_9CARY|nr:SAP6 [Tamarix hispida]